MTETSAVLRLIYLICIPGAQLLLLYLWDRRVLGTVRRRWRESTLFDNPLEMFFVSFCYVYMVGAWIDYYGPIGYGVLCFASVFYFVEVEKRARISGENT